MKKADEQFTYYVCKTDSDGLPRHETGLYITAVNPKNDVLPAEAAARVYLKGDTSYGVDPVTLVVYELTHYVTAQPDLSVRCSIIEK